MSQELIKSNREKIEDQYFSSDMANKDYKNKLFIRVTAKKLEFNNIEFSYSSFDSCYLRNCSFKNCKFIGCRFVSSVLNGSSFIDCKFDYASFEKTKIDSDVLVQSAPSKENMKLKFARTLRLNYQTLGEAQSANKAMNIELQATETHLKNSWLSKENYYRTKYKGFKRLSAFFEWLNFKALDFFLGKWREYI